MGKVSPPLPPHDERVKLLFAPIIINYYGGARCTWSGVITDDTDKDTSHGRALKRAVEGD